MNNLPATHESGELINEGSPDNVDLINKHIPKEVQELTLLTIGQDINKYFEDKKKPSRISKKKNFVGDENIDELIKNNQNINRVNNRTKQDWACKFDSEGNKNTVRDYLKLSIQDIFHQPNIGVGEMEMFNLFIAKRAGIGACNYSIIFSKLKLITIKRGSDASRIEAILNGSTKE